MINKNKYCILNLAFLCLCLEIYFTFGEKYEALGKDSAMGDAMAMRSLLENNLGMIIVSESPVSNYGDGLHGRYNSNWRG